MEAPAPTPQEVQHMAGAGSGQQEPTAGVEGSDGCSPRQGVHARPPPRLPRLRLVNVPAAAGTAQPSASEAVSGTGQIGGGTAAGMMPAAPLPATGQEETSPAKEAGAGLQQLQQLGPDDLLPRPALFSAGPGMSSGSMQTMQTQVAHGRGPPDMQVSAGRICIYMHVSCFICGDLGWLHAALPPHKLVAHVRLPTQEPLMGAGPSNRQQPLSSLHRAHAAGRPPRAARVSIPGALLHCRCAQCSCTSACSIYTLLSQCQRGLATAATLPNQLQGRAAWCPSCCYCCSSAAPPRRSSRCESIRQPGRT